MSLQNDDPIVRALAWGSRETLSQDFCMILEKLLAVSAP